MKTYTIEEIADKYIGKQGTAKRDAFEEELQRDVMAQAIKKNQEKRHLAQMLNAKSPASSLFSAALSPERA
ncbi:MAG: hypothetical protein LBT94_00035 [Prevotellaceae bacterium]|jgi:hypothetical protein|nr:hypothetical protein [Prevotellaceae bacterium]